MDQEKRSMITAEIKQWRSNKLLPEQYCDFLLNLYEDKDSPEARTMLGIPSAAITNSSWLRWVVIFGIIGIMTFLFLHFISFQLWMQVLITVSLLSFLYLFGVLMRRRQPALSFASFAAASLLLLTAGLYLLHANQTAGFAVVVFAVVCSMVWILTGIATRFSLFHVAGWIMLFLIYGMVLQHNVGDMDLMALELSWLPISLLLALLGWLFHYMNKQIAAVLLSMGLLSWFGAEIYGFIFTEVDSYLIQVLIAVKLLICCGALFISRKKWIEWVV